MRAVIFDLGNVLAKYDHAATVQALAAISQGDATTIATLLAEVSHALNVGDLSGDHLHRLLVERAGTKADFALFQRAYCSGITPDEDAFSYALALRARDDLTVAVISNTNDVHVTWLDAHVPHLAEFDLVMMSNEVHLAKPDPAIYRLALELLEVEASAAVLIDDLEENVIGAQAVGLAGIVHEEWAATQAQLTAWLGV